MKSASSVCEVILISGYLGAGKTTLLRHFLSSSKGVEGVAILVNEFGRVGIDGDLVKGLGAPVVELTNGCICCSLQGELVNGVLEILEGFHPKRLLIEATGVADPLEIQAALVPSRLKCLSEAPWIVTVLDGDLWEGRDCFGHVFYDQIKAADLLLFNKVDLLPTEKVDLYLQQARKLNPACRIIPTEHCRIDPELLRKPSPGARADAVEAPLRLNGLRETARELGYASFAFEKDTPFEQGRFRRFLETLPPTLYRVKGYALLGTDRFLVNHVGGRTQWRKLDEKGATRLAFVGWRIEEEKVLRDLERCLDEAP